MLTAYIGMGANLPSPAGSPEATLAAAASRLVSLGRVAGRSSSIPLSPLDSPTSLASSMPSSFSKPSSRRTSCSITCSRSNSNSAAIAQRECQMAHARSI